MRDFATHAISTWLCSDGSFHDEAQDMAADDPAGGALRDWAREVLYGPQETLSADDRHTLEQVRDGISRDAFELLVDWVAVRHDLLEF
jgi:hypothetical protein